MQTRDFVETALNSAAISLEAFTEVLESKDADINYKPTFYGHPLIHSLIEKMDDDDLPELLAILVEKGADLEIRDLRRTPISLAAYLLKIKTVRFLLDQHVEINNLKNPPLCTAINCNLILAPEADRLALVQLLLENGADVNGINSSNETPLILAIRNKCPLIVSHLIRNGSNISIKKYHFDQEEQYETAMGIAYRNYSSNNTQCFKMTLELLFVAAKEYLYKECAGSILDGKSLSLHLTEIAHNLADDFPGFPIIGKISFPSKVLEEDVITPVLERIQQEKEQRHAFEMAGATKSHQNQSEVSSFAIHRFFKQTNGRDLVTHIFSYVHEITPHMENIKKLNKR